MSQPLEVSQRDLRLRSREIMDAVEAGHSFVVTRDGHRIGQLVPLRERQRFVSRADFVHVSSRTPTIDIDVFRADVDALLDPVVSDPYDR